MIMLIVLVLAVFLPLSVEDQLLYFRDKWVVVCVRTAAELPIGWQSELVYLLLLFGRRLFERLLGSAARM